MMGLSDKKEAIIDMVELMQDERMINYVLEMLREEIKQEIEKGLISP